MSNKSRVIINGKYLDENAATYEELMEWLQTIPESSLKTPLMMGFPNGEVYAIRKPTEKSETFFQGEAILVETEEEDSDG